MTLKTNCGGVLVNNIVLRSLMFADDLVLFSDSSEGLNIFFLMALESYCGEYKNKSYQNKSSYFLEYKEIS